MKRRCDHCRKLVDIDESNIFNEGWNCNSCRKEHFICKSCRLMFRYNSIRRVLNTIELNESLDNKFERRGK